MNYQISRFMGDKNHKTVWVLSVCKWDDRDNERESVVKFVQFNLNLFKVLCGMEKER